MRKNSKALASWSDEIKDAQIGRWLNRNFGKPVEKWVNKHIAKPLKRLFGGGGGGRHAAPEIYHADMPMGGGGGPNNLAIFGASGGGGISISGSGPGISAGDVADTVLDFVPIVGGLKDIYQGINDGNGWMVALDAGSIVADVFTLGGSSLFKGGIKTGIKIGARSVASSAAKGGSSVLSKGELIRIGNAATRINKPITVVGSRAKGTAGVYSDWDYVIPGLNNKNWKTIKNSLPGSRSILNNTPRNIDIFKGPVNPNLPYITIYPH